jgi:hypothetical protein
MDQEIRLRIECIARNAHDRSKLTAVAHHEAERGRMSDSDDFQLRSLDVALEQSIVGLHNGLFDGALNEAQGVFEQETAVLIMLGGFSVGYASALCDLNNRVND